jgi:hypothetical protein
LNSVGNVSSKESTWADQGRVRRNNGEPIYQKLLVAYCPIEDAVICEFIYNESQFVLVRGIYLLTIAYLYLPRGK